MPKNIAVYLFLSLLFVISACSVKKPKDFSYRYNQTINTGLDQKLNMDGYYALHRECDSAFSSVFMFYPDGLFVIATGTDLAEVSNCLATNASSTICNYPSWGVYKLVDDTIKTQSVLVLGFTGITIFRDYLVQADGTLVNLSDYVFPENSNVGHMREYPSFTQNRCQKVAVFTPLKTKRDASQCPLMRSKWFLE